MLKLNQNRCPLCNNNENIFIKEKMRQNYVLINIIDILYPNYRKKKFKEFPKPIYKKKKVTQIIRNEWVSFKSLYTILRFFIFCILCVLIMRFFFEINDIDKLLLIINKHIKESQKYLEKIKDDIHSVQILN